MSGPGWSLRNPGGRPGEDVAAAGGALEHRARRTAAAVQAGTGRLWPHWLERQLDPAASAFVPAGPLAPVANVTGRSWTVVGNVGSARRPHVDPRGLVSSGGWSLDWWVGAEDRWHLPSREPAVRQRLVADAPVVETAMRVPGGDVVERVYGIRAASGGEELVVVEVENATPVPVALAVAVRPYDVDGVTVVERIGLDGAIVTVDGRTAVLLPRAPNRVAGATFDEGDVAATVLGGDAGTTFPTGLRCGRGLASAAFVYPLPHRSTLSFLLPLAPSGPARRGSASRRAARTARPAVPTGAQVANGWRAHADRGMRLVLPDTRLAAAVAANRRYLLLFGAGMADVSAPPSSEATVAVLGALDRHGYADDVAEALASHAELQRADGSLPGQGPGSTGAFVHAVAEHWRLSRDETAIDGMEPAIAAAAEAIERGQAATRRRATRVGPAVAPGDPLAPAGWRGPDHLHQDLWGLRGLLDAAELLGALGEDGAADAARRGAEQIRAGVDASLSAVASGLDRATMPPGRRRGVDPPVLAALAACWPLRIAPADDDRVVAAAEAVRVRSCHGPAVLDGAGHTGLGTHLTLQLGLVELAAGDRRALDRLDWLLAVATPTWTWPEAVHPRTDGGSAGDGHDARTAADLLTFVRNLLVRETVDGGLALCSLVPDAWLGGQLEVHDAPTHHGRLSYALRWHGDRPALLWELVPHDGGAGVPITAPGLDPGWSTSELRGDALLAPVAPPPAAAVEPSPEPPVTPVRLSGRRPRPG